MIIGVPKEVKDHETRVGHLVGRGDVGKAAFAEAEAAAESALRERDAGHDKRREHDEQRDGTAPRTVHVREVSPI